MVSYLATAILAVSALASDPQSVQWQDNYGTALAETRASAEKPLLVVLDEPQSDETRVQPALLHEGSTDKKDTELLKHYHLVHIDASTKYGQKVAGVFRAKRFPHIAIIDRSGKTVLFKKSGKISETEWQNALESNQDGEPLQAHHVSYQMSGGASESTASSAPSTPTYHSNSYCPSCQRKKW